MPLIDTVFGSLQKFHDNTDRQMRLVKVLPNDQLLVWHIRSISKDDVDSVLTMLHPKYVAPITLQKLNIWDMLQDQTRSIIEQSFAIFQRSQAYKDSQTYQSEAVAHGATINDDGEVVQKEHHRGRKSKVEWADLPREIPCIKCSNTQYIPPSILVQKAGLEGLIGEARRIKLQVFLDNFQCSTCKPGRRGRQRNPLFKNIPRKVNCSKCNKECVINAKALHESTGGDKDKIAAFAKGYLCKKCNPNTGSWLRGKGHTGHTGHRGRKASAENEGFAKTATCIVCGKEVGIVPSQIRGKAAKLGVTVEALLLNYKCRSCGGVVRTKKSKKVNVGA